VYIPLGGNRKGTFQTYRNLFIVFFLTGLWHGASWTMIVWGLFHGFFLVLERLSLGKILPKVFFLNRIYTLLVIMIAWVFFKSPDIHFAISYIGKMFGSANVELGESLHYAQFLTIDFVLLFSLALLGASGIIQEAVRRFENNRFMLRANAILTPISYAGSLVLLVICSMIITRQGYNPFIYFQF
jgi:alginate O-acetyltransferase complex protein AlgI